MKKTLTLVVLLTCGLSWASAQDATTLQVAPSDQVKYPDASEILNKTDPAAAKTPIAKAGLPGSTLPTNKPLLASVPVLAAAAPRAPAAPLDPEHGWFLKWTLSGDENGALGWVQALDLPASLHPISAGLWEVWAGPLDASGLKAALKGQGGLAVLVRR
jgi:hypothetical protein